MPTTSVDLALVINIIGALLAFVMMILVGMIGWVVRSMVRDLRDLETKYSELPKIYVLKEDNVRDMIEIKGLLKDISNKLDRKADK